MRRITYKIGLSGKTKGLPWYASLRGVASSVEFILPLYGVNVNSTLLAQKKVETSRPGEKNWHKNQHY
jgi:hypothetical protein